LTAETTSLAATDDELTVASFNVYNLDPSDTAEKFSTLASQIVNNLGAPDIIGMQEIQDNTGSTNDGTVDASLTWSTLITAVQNAGGPTYEYRDIAPENNQDGGAPGANIRVGFLFNPNRVTLAERGVATATTATTPTTGTTGIELTFSPGRVNPTHPAVAASRKSLAAEFTFNEHKLFIVVNHFNSKSGDAPVFGNIQPPVFVSEVERQGIAQITNDFVDSILALDPDANVIVLGDLNDFHFSQAVSDTLTADVLTNLMYTVPITDRYTYIFEGNAQVLDHVLVSDHLISSAAPEFDVVHVNAEFVDNIFSSSRRASDHDPVLARFQLPSGATIYLPLVMRNS
jgi:predicted extracellular nuclease